MNLSPEQEQELKRMLKQVVWDYKIPEEELLEIFHNRQRRNWAIDQIQLKAKLLNGFYLHKLIRLLGREQIMSFFADNVLVQIFPVSYRNRLKHVKRIILQ